MKYLRSCGAEYVENMEKANAAKGIEPSAEPGAGRKTAFTARASITVEAVFVIPVIMLLFLMLLWFSFYLHDRAAAEGAILEMLEEGGEYVLYGALPDVGTIAEEKGSFGGLRYAVAQPSREERRQWERSFARKLKGKLFLYQIAGFSCDKTEKGTRVYAKFSCAAFFPAKWWGLGELFYVEYDYDRLCPVREEVTRVGSVVLDLYENVLREH